MSTPRSLLESFECQMRLRECQRRLFVLDGLVHFLNCTFQPGLTDSG